jgi:hypothetical protein
MNIDIKHLVWQLHASEFTNGSIFIAVTFSFWLCLRITLAIIFNIKRTAFFVIYINYFVNSIN